MKIQYFVLFAIIVASVAGCTKDNTPANPPAPTIVDSVVSSSLQIVNLTSGFFVGRIDVGNLPLSAGWDSTLALGYPLAGSASIDLKVHSSQPEFLYIFYLAIAPHTITIIHAAGSVAFNVQPGQSAIYAPSIVFARNVPVILRVD
jgi:hypothetical protein